MLSVIIIYLHLPTNSSTIIMHTRLNNPPHYDRINNKKYQSVVFLSQRFGASSIQQTNPKILSQKFNDHNLTVKHALAADSHTKQHENLQMFGDMSIADKIRILRKPTYINGTKTSNKITNKFKIVADQEILPTQTNTHKTISPHYSNHICKARETQRKQTQRSKKVKQEISMKIVKKNSKKSLPENNGNQGSKGNAQTDRRLFTQAQLETERCPEAEFQREQNENERCKTELKETNGANNESVRWASKSSLEWVELDKNDAVGDSTQRSSKKIKANKSKLVVIPKSCLYMSMYLRMRDKQQAFGTNNNAQKKLMTINKIQNQVQAQCHPSQYFLKLKQNKSMPSTYTFYALASKFKCKKSNKDEASQRMYESGCVILDKSMIHCEGRKEFVKSLNKKRYRKDSCKMSPGRGPTIRIDPW